MNAMRFARIAVLLAVLVTITGCPGTNRVKADAKLLSVSDGRAKLDAYGYMQSCVNETLLFVDEDGKWVQVEQDLPVELYTLDGEWVGGAPGYCDVVMCELGRWQPEVKFVGYKEIGESVYQTVPISGTKKVVLDIYEDDRCVLKRRFEFIIDE